MTTPCFALIQADGEELDTGDGVPHYPTLEQATEYAARFTRDAFGNPCPPPTPKQLDKPCVFMQCSKCDYALDEDDCMTYHFESQQEADVMAESYDWTVTGDRRLCPECSKVPATANA